MKKNFMCPAEDENRKIQEDLEVTDEIKLLYESLLKKRHLLNTYDLVRFTKVDNSLNTKISKKQELQNKLKAKKLALQGIQNETDDIYKQLSVNVNNLGCLLELVSDVYLALEKNNKNACDAKTQTEDTLSQKRKIETELTDAKIVGESSGILSIKRSKPDSTDEKIDINCSTDTKKMNPMVKIQPFNLAELLLCIRDLELEIHL